MSSDYRLMQQRIEFNLDLDATLLDRTYTIAQSTVAEGKYIVQSRCPSDVGYVKFAIEPYRGTTHFLLDWCITQEQIPQQFLPAVIKGIKLAACAGLGECKPVINLRIQLIDGYYHAVDSRARSYQVATELAVRAAFEKVGLILIT